MFNHAVRHPIQVKARNFSLSRPGWDGTFSFIFFRDHILTGSRANILMFNHAVRHPIQVKST